VIQEEIKLNNNTYLDLVNNYLIASQTDKDGIITQVSKAMCEISGYSEEELIGQKHSIIRHPDMPDSVFKDLWDTITSGQMWEGEVKNKKKDGKSYWVQTKVSPTFDENNEIIGYASIRVDITDKKKIEELSVTDELTKMYNRRHFNIIFSKEINRAKRENKTVGFAIFDVDNFKLYNDYYGHLKGDKVLKKIAKVTKENLKRAGDYCFRLGGEEFGILIYDIDLKGFETVVENIRNDIEDLDMEHLYNKTHEVVTASFGGVVFHCSTKIPSQKIYQFTDELVYFSKKNGRNRSKVEPYDSLKESEEILENIRSLQEKIENDHISKLEKLVNEKTQELQESYSKLESYASAIDVNSIVSVSDPKGFIKYVNNKFCEVSGYTQEEVIGKPHNIIRHPDTPKEVFKEMWETIQSKKIWQGQVKNRKKNGDPYIVQSAIVPILDSNGNIYEYIATRYEITTIYQQQKELEKQKQILEKQIRKDILTGLGNRFSLHETIATLQNGSIALIDINKFHEINDFYGDQVGDKVIAKFASMLQEELKDYKYKLFHLQGDEFMILNTCYSRNEFVEHTQKLSKKLNYSTIQFDDKIFYPSTTISLSFEPTELLTSTVNLAHTFAKENNIVYNIYSYDSSPEKHYANNFKWTKKIKKAIEDDKIVVYLQPIVDSISQKPIKHEALVRLIDENNDVISPFFFLDIAKKSNYYTKITKKVIAKSLNYVQRTNTNVSINITIEDIKNKKIKKDIFDRLKKLDNCDKVTFELVESEGIENFEEVNQFIHTIKSFGCKLAIDDFGTGYSNFEYLLKLNADYIKIDGSIIKDIDLNEDKYHIVKTIVNFAKVKNIKLIAEFVSSETIYEKIKSLEIDYCQGFYFGKPEPIQE
jgi:diguanylate cyclase (GGDEF)-like protein/PAS domain S-box-containing protein